MSKINSIRIEGFRRLRDVSLEMRPLMVLIGANGVGKTSLLDAIALFSASAAGALKKTLSDMGGVAENATRGSDGTVRLWVEFANIPEGPLAKYFFGLQPKGQGYRISCENLVLEDGEFINSTPVYLESGDYPSRYFDASENRAKQPNWDLDPLESLLSQVPKSSGLALDIKNAVLPVSRYHLLDLGPRAAVKLPQQLKPATSPGPDGEDLVSFLYNLRESDRDRFEIIEDTLRTAFPGFEGLSFPAVAAGMLSLTWKEKYFRDPVYMHQLSEGTLRFLWLISILQSPAPSAITMIDEPEVSLHPELLSLLAELLRECASGGKTQLIVATHSDRLIRALEPKEVVAMDTAEDGSATATWADQMNIEKWLDEYTLDEVWRMGRMGGLA